jgi:tetratricopeptide (TPR) repeat protein
MADGDTLALAEEKVLQRAQRRAVEEAGMYLESTFLDFERTTGGKNFQTSSLEIRTIAAAITKTEIIEFQRSFENDRPSFFVRIRAVVNLDNLQTAIHRWQSEQQFAQHFRQLQKENAELKAQLHELKTTPVGVRTLVIEPPGRGEAHRRARTLVEQAILTQNLRQKLDMTSQAATLAPQSVDPLIVRGQTYLRLVSAAYSNKSKPSEYSEYIDNARMDFDRALMIDPKNTWALLGQGDVNTWLQRPDDAAHSYEQALTLNPFFDIAHHRLINLYTTQARRLTITKQWSSALEVLQKLLSPQVPDSWIPYHKEAYFLRSDVYNKLNQPTQAIEDLSMILRVEPTDAHALLARAKLYQEQLQGRTAKDDLERACLLGSAEACEQLP